MNCGIAIYAPCIMLHYSFSLSPSSEGPLNFCCCWENACLTDPSCKSECGRRTHPPRGRRQSPEGQHAATWGIEISISLLESQRGIYKCASVSSGHLDRRNIRGIAARSTRINEVIVKSCQLHQKAVSRQPKPANSPTHHL